jgi:uncharacterized membrane protein
MMDNSGKDSASQVREAKQLRRLETVMDVVYAILIWRAFQLLPRPTKADWSLEGMKAFMSANALGYILVVVFILLVIIYWIQNNVLFNNLDHTDGKHTALSIAQLFSLLLFLYAIKLGMDVGAGAATRAIESITALLVGLTSAAAWGYAIKDRRLLAPDVTQEHAVKLRKRYYAEPVTAALTVPFAFVGPIVWELSWFLYPFMVKLSKRAARAKTP